MSAAHPYTMYEHEKAWNVLSRGLADLESNGDIEQKTASVYIVGYLSKLLAEAGILDEPAGLPPSKKKDPSKVITPPIFSKAASKPSVNKLAVKKSPPKKS